MRPAYHRLKLSGHRYEYTVDDNAYTVSPLNLPSFGDETFVFRMTSGLVEFDVAYVRVGGLVMALSQAATIISTASSPSR